MWPSIGTHPGVTDHEQTEVPLPPADGRGGAPQSRIVIVGSAARDIDESDPRGWRLGGGVTYGALLLGRVGLRTTALIGLDREASTARELGMLRDAGVEVMAVPLEHGPVFHNIEAPGGRRQRVIGASDPLPITSATPELRRSACAWLFAPVADEIPSDWATVPDAAAFVALGWQGLLRDLTPGSSVVHRSPADHPLVRRAQLVSASAQEIPRDRDLVAVGSLLGADAELLITRGRRGGATVGPDGHLRVAYPPVPVREAVDPTGAGDVMLAALVAALVSTGAYDRRPIRSRGRHLRFAATAASLVVEQPGLDAVPDRAAIRDRLAAGDTLAQPA
jgi:sugar/nucleoside kinase (ribokinase family)